MTLKFELEMLLKNLISKLKFIFSLNVIKVSFLINEKVFRKKLKIISNELLNYS